MLRKGPGETVGEPDSQATRSSLIRRLHDWGDDGGWHDFFATYWKLIYAVAVRSGLSDSEAQDVVQETIVSVARQFRDGGYNRSRGAFKPWLYTIARRRIVDHLRKRGGPKGQFARRDLESDDGTDALNRIPDESQSEMDALWEAEWQKNLLDAAIERVKQQVTPKQFQVFDLSVLRQVPTTEVTKLLHVNAAQVYLARHRVGALVKKEFCRLEKLANNPPNQRPS